MIRPCTLAEIPTIAEIIADAARAYEGAIPDDLWHEPYMPRDEVEGEIAAGVRFSAYEANGRILGVMGIQDVGDATLIRHAYVRTKDQHRGIGGALMTSLIPRAQGKLLVGTWQAATWAIRFYERHGFVLASSDEKDALLTRYWRISPRQREVSVVLAYPR